MLFTFATITLALRIAGSVTLSQTPDPAPRELLAAARALTPAEVAIVLAGFHALDFVYESIDLRRPEGGSVPDCVR